MSLPAIGSPAPNFSALDQQQNMRSLAEFKGKKLILYFYPKDNTSGCTMQANNLKEHYAKLQSLGFEVVGVSCDSVQSHQKFCDNQGLPFTLLADTERKIVTDYGVYGEKTMMGRKYMGINRTTFIINEAQVIEHIILKPKTKEHTQEILALYNHKL